MKENLFFRATRPILQKAESCSIFFLLILLPLLSIPTFFSASALEVDVLQQDPQAIIYVSENAVIFGIEEVTNARIVKIKTPSKVKDFSKTAAPKIKKQIPTPKTEVRNQIKNLPKLSRPKFVFQSKKSDESFGAGAFSNSKNSVVTTFFVSEGIVSCLYTKLHIPVFVYKMNIYTADFIKTAALSQFLFSRPPPYC